MPGTTCRSAYPARYWSRGYIVTRGYWQVPEATAAAIDAEGWLRTVDVGRFNARGFLEIVDPKKDTYIVGGFNAYPAEIEHTLRRHPDVRDVAMIGVADERMGEMGAAFIVGTKLSERGLLDWARERLASFKGRATSCSSTTFFVTRARMCRSHTCAPCGVLDR